MERATRKQRTACEVCRSRKVRCDVETTAGNPCTVCKRGNFQCVIKTDWPAPKRRKGAAGRSSVPTDVDPVSEALPSPSTTKATVSSNGGAHQATAAKPGHHSTSKAQPANQDRPDQLARTGLSRFFQEGVNFTNWHVFGLRSQDSFRLAYIGSPVSNLAQLVQLRLTHKASIASAGDAEQAAESFVSLHYPYPQIRPNPTWKPDTLSVWRESTTPRSTDLSDDLGEFPLQEVSESLLNAYFDHIHPSFPVVARAHFYNTQNSPTWKPPSPLLYQAVLLAGAHVCSHPLVERDRWMVKAILFRRASMLFHLRRETDRLFLTQAALLFTWHINDGDTVSGGPWYWAGIAVRLGYGQGTHRHNPILPTLERVLHKRTWWCAVVLEVFSALEFGRPCSVQWVAIDQTLPTEEDLGWGEYSIDESPNDQWPENAAHMSNYHVAIIQLARIGLEIVEMNFPGGPGSRTVPAIDDRLVSWSIQLGLTTQPGQEDFLARQLGLHYNLLVLYLHRSYTKVLPASQKACSVASDAILNLLDQFSAQSEFGRCHSTIVSAVTAVSIHLIYEIRSAIQENAYLATVGLLERLSQVLKYTKQLLPLWPNAEAIHNVFEGLKREYEQFITRRVYEQASPSIPESPTDWTDLFASNFINQTEQFGTQQPWLDLVNWTELIPRT